MAGDAWKFITAFLREPRQVGAVWPSSAALARRMADGVDWSAAHTVLELGPGTGVLTREIVARAQPSTRIGAIEINSEFAELLRQRYPRVEVFTDSVARTSELCTEAGIPQVDAILSGLPWAVFTDADQHQFLSSAASTLKPGGQFVTFAYLQGLLLPAAKRFRKLLESQFTDVRLSRTVWLNVPPALAYYCVK
ncbi:MAG: methyltransferase domain-containing protein [Planctomycetales bacterium]|nr:methyltransferase domain-containing protein [Planctomycetales bacterium]